MEILIKLIIWLVVLGVGAKLFRLYEIFYREPSEIKDAPTWTMTGVFWIFMIVSALWIFSR
jgi:hypothetical protein